MVRPITYVLYDDIPLEHLAAIPVENTRIIGAVEEVLYLDAIYPNDLMGAEKPDDLIGRLVRVSDRGRPTKYYKIVSREGTRFVLQEA